MLHLASQIDAAVAAIRDRWQGHPRVGVILGTGLGGLVADIEIEASLDYDAIPHFVRSTAHGHSGRLVFGRLGGVSVVAMAGRVHAYEGYSLQQITLPVRVMKALGIELLIVTNAAGGMNPQYALGDIMMIDDHINLMNSNPLIGINDERLGPRFPDLCRPYDAALIARALELGRLQNTPMQKGVFVSVVGPNLETRAEYRFLRLIGADAVGMLTVPEVLVAVHAGLRVLGFSIITDLCLPDALKPANIEEIIAVANRVEPHLRKIVAAIVSEHCPRHMAS